MKLFSSKMGAPSQYFHEVTDWLNNTFEDRWMGRGGPIPWPARSPDLTPLDFWLWGYLKEIVYAQSPKTIPDLKQAISDAISQIPNRMVQTYQLPSRDIRQVIVCCFVLSYLMRVPYAINYRIFTCCFTPMILTSFLLLNHG